MAATSNDYEESLVAAARSVLLELAHLLHNYFDSMVVVGGSVPALLLQQSSQAHIGTLDVDVALDHNSIPSIAYSTIVQLLVERGYIPGEQPYIFYRKVKSGVRTITVQIDFLAGEYGGTGKQHRTQRIQDLQPRKARGCDLAFINPEQVMIEGVLPEGGIDRANIHVVSMVPFLMMKAQALAGRMKEKDAYDIYYCLQNYPGGNDALAELFHQFQQSTLVLEGLQILTEKYASPEHTGPVFTANFLDVADTDARALIQRDAYERVSDLLRIVRTYRL